MGDIVGLDPKINTVTQPFFSLSNNRQHTFMGIGPKINRATWAYLKFDRVTRGFLKIFW